MRTPIHDRTGRRPGFGRMVLGLVALLIALAAPPAWAVDDKSPDRWSAEKANAWYREMPWLVGCNFGPSTAINQLEMWQAESWDPKTIDRELGWAEDLGFNSVRVFLHHLLWEQDPEGFLKRMDEFLDLCEKHKIGVMPVLFDSVWDPNPKLGKQRDPIPHLHNSGWVQSPGAADLTNPDRQKLLESYVRGVVGHFKDDKRIQVWDVFNEPDNTNDNSYGPKSKRNKNMEPDRKVELSVALLRKTFQWARESKPSQPLTSGMWRGDRDWSKLEGLPEVDRVQIEESDVISFHTYDKLDEVKRRVEGLKRHGRPILCTEYMARPRGSTFEDILPYFKEEKVGAYNWGFVAGKTQTIYPWDSWERQYEAEPPVWFHDIFRADGSIYRPEEVKLIKRLTGKDKGGK